MANVQRQSVYRARVTRRKQQRPGVAKNNKNNGTNKSTNKPATRPPNSQRTEVEPIHPSSDTPLISRHSFPTTAHGTTLKQSILYASHTHPRPRHSDTRTGQQLDCTRPSQQIKPYTIPLRPAYAALASHRAQPKVLHFTKGG